MDVYIYNRDRVRSGDDTTGPEEVGQSQKIT